MSSSVSEFWTVLELCEDKHRRIVLAVLAEQQRPVTMDDLTKTVVEHDHPTSLAATSGEIVTRIKADLHHIHIPRLERTELVEYDSERQLVEPTAEFDRVEPRLSTILDADPELATPLWEERSVCVTESREDGE